MTDKTKWEELTTKVDSIMRGLWVLIPKYGATDAAAKRKTFNKTKYWLENEINQQVLSALEEVKSRARTYYRKELNYAPDGDAHRDEITAVPLSAIIEIEKEYK